jgi:arabinose-5-phosphate isomerase
LGLVGVVNSQRVLVGIITDGDLRRNLSADLLKEKAKQVMSADPVTIAPDKLAAEAVYVMNNNRKGVEITAIFVVNKEGHPVGVLHIHACLRAGVV